MMKKPELLIEHFKDRIKANEPLAPFTYVKIGGPADWVLIVQSKTELVQAVKLLIKDNFPFLILGSASNIMISDEGIPGVVIINRSQDVKLENPYNVRADSGTLMSQLVHFTLDNKLAGIEEFLGIPGTVGGAIYNNSHHLHHLIGDYIESVEVIDRKGTVKTLSQTQCEFLYDDSVFQRSHEVIISALFSLAPATVDIRSKALEALKRRKNTQPLEYPSSGCMFKNVTPEVAKKIGMPSGVVAAGWLVDQSGCKGLQIGQARVSDKHANFMVNLGGASARNYIDLSNQVRRRVHETFGIWLEREIFFLGEHQGLEE